MSLLLDCDSSDELCCDQCRFKISEYDYSLYHFTHKSEPIVSLVRLSETTLKKLKCHSYKLNNGVAKRTLGRPRNPVSSLKISIKKQQGSVEFQVIKKRKSRKKIKRSSREGSGESGRESEILQPRAESNVKAKVDPGDKEVEGNSLQERFGANISVSRKVSPLQLQKIKEKDANEEDALENNGNVSKEISRKLSQERILEQLLSGGISVIKQNPVLSKADSTSEEVKLPKIVSVFSTNAEAMNNLKNGPEETSREMEKQKLNKSSILKKLSGLGFSLIPKTSNGASPEEGSHGNDNAEKENKLQKINAVKDTDLEIFVRPKNGTENVTNNENVKNSKSDSFCVIELSNAGKIGDSGSVLEKGTGKSVVNGSEPGADLNGDGRPLSKRNVKVYSNSRNKKYVESERRDNKIQGVDGKKRESDLVKVGGGSCDGQSGIGDGTRKKLKGPATRKSQWKPQTKDKESVLKMGIDSSPVKQLRPDFIAPRRELVTPPLNHSEVPFSNSEEQSNRLQGSDDCSVLLDPERGNENGEKPTFNSVTCDDGFRPEPYAEGNNEGGQQGDEVAVSFSSLPNEDQSHGQPQQDPLMTSEPGPGSGEGINQNFLHNFLNDSQTPQSNIQSEGSEYMSLERLGQVSGLDGKHGQKNFDVGNSEPSTPMEQLSQQVQRLSSPQINVIPRHHLQAPQPPQLHAGLSPLAQQQSKSSFDALGHIPSQMPPPLYQGYNMYNQSFPSQNSPQLSPRAPAPSQRSQIQNRSFQNATTTIRARSRSYPTKRNSTRAPRSQDLPPKQRRMEQPVPPRSQPSVSPTTKIPSGITVTPAKKSLNASKVANVLASRGITVTPSSAAPRQSPPSNRSHQRSNPVLNIGPGVSITTNNNSSRSGGGFAVPAAPRRNSPIVNTDVERPERCATVDLTQDDDPPPASHNRRMPGARFPCNQCKRTYPTSEALESHKASHLAVPSLPFKCDKCSAQYPTAGGLQKHKSLFHKAKQMAPDLAIPIVDLNHPGAREQLVKCGIHGFLPLTQLQSNSLGYFGVPIVHLDSTKEKAIPSMASLGAANVLVLGKMKTLTQPQIR